MKIGILTFHWATNYGAVLQCYALQEYLRIQGHDVEVINYKPKQYDDNIFTFLRFRKFLNLDEYLSWRKKESALVAFRNSHLRQTKRISRCKDLAKIANCYDVVISGSDQVANPSFLMFGEGKNVISPTYFLGFSFQGKRVSYAFSFGCINYPEEPKKIASKYISAFDYISVREISGISIVKAMGRDDAKLVPDPTLLMESDFYNFLVKNAPLQIFEKYVYCFFIRHIVDRKAVMNKVLDRYNIIWNNEDDDYTMEGWLCKIKCSKFVVTDSFHCVVMCLKLHIPFVVITEQKGNVGMNDRLYTLLAKLNLCKQICFKDNILECEFKWNYNWDEIDLSLKCFSEIGKFFLKNICI